MATFFCVSPIQPAGRNSFSEGLIESLQRYHRSGRSLDSLEKTIEEFCEDTFFDARNLIQTA